MFEDANNIVNEDGGKKDKEIITMSEYYEKQRRKLLAELVNNRDTDILSNITIVDDTLKLKEHNKKRVGRPKFNWYLNALEQYWNFIKAEHQTQYRFDMLDISNQEHTKVIIEAAKELVI